MSEHRIADAVDDVLIINKLTTMSRQTLTAAAKCLRIQWEEIERLRALIAAIREEANNEDTEIAFEHWVKALIDSAEKKAFMDQHGLGPEDMDGQPDINHPD